VDSTLFGDEARLAFTRAVLEGMQAAADSAMSGTLTAFILKQLKGAGVHAKGAKSHNLYPGDNAAKPEIAAALQRGALTPGDWALVRENMKRAGGGPAGKTVVTELGRPLVDIGQLPMTSYRPGEKAVPASAMAQMVAALGDRDPHFVVTNADGNEASNMKVINERLKIRHPTEDGLYNQSPDGQVYEPLNEDACAGFAAGLALFGGRSLWISYESFAINGWPIVQTVGQAMAGNDRVANVQPAGRYETLKRQQSGAKKSGRSEQADTVRVYLDDYQKVPEAVTRQRSTETVWLGQKKKSR
jgi:phosphoketolase